jgi:nitrite reductase/ring-hydroxylating ferredoxin subunit
MMKRREFLAASAGCACLMLTKAGLAEPKAATATTGPVKVGDLKSFTKEGLDIHFLKHGFFLVRGKDRLYALSAFCTHKTDTRLEGTAGAEKIICPRHHAQFALDGTVTRPPAKRNLSRLAITVDDKGQVTVDTSKTISPDKADDPTAFVKIG